VSVVVTRLVDAGLVSRDRDSRDARRLVLNLTKAGRALLQKAPPVAQQQLIAVIDRLAAADRRHFAETFEWVLAELGAEGGAAPMLFEDGSEAAQKKPAPRKKS
jgi:DNA-binding MarR family transcriptional regulator